VEKGLHHAIAVYRQSSSGGAKASGGRDGSAGSVSRAQDQYGDV